MNIIGITGPTGAGKTTLLREVEKLGGAVIDCDAVYHEMLESDFTLQDKLENMFGPLRDREGRIDRKKLGNIVFKDPVQLERLNRIVGRAITDRTRTLVDGFCAQGKTLAAIDAIALLESPLRELCKLTVAVLAPPEVRVRRIMVREGISEDYAWSRVRAQKPDEYFSQNCDHTLINDCPAAEIFSQNVRKFLEEVLL